ncbi:MAG TPA: DNRLRE domain-containing protein [Candidatus Polarisedimenticolia bacterium]|jgi:hypothetical protein
MRTSVILLATLSCTFSTALAETVTLEASRDAALIENPDGALANGSGPAWFVGRTAQAVNGVRRALVAFDANGALPDHAVIESVSLTLFMTPSNPEPRTIRLYRVLADWGEGPSSSSGGGGAPAGPGDATWIHTFWDTDLWVHAGGQFLGRASAQLEVGGSGLYTWRSTVHLVQDVRLWSASPDRNFGWILIGDEGAPQTVKSFASRENSDSMLHPHLEITYDVPGEPPLE